MPSTPLLEQFNQAVLSVGDVKTVLGTAVSCIDRIVSVKGGALGLYHEATKEVVVEAVHGEACQELRGSRCGADEGKMGEVLRRGVPLVLSNVAHEPLLKRVGHDIQQARLEFLWAPLQWGKSALGVLGLGCPRNSLSSEDLDFIGSVASFLSPTVLLIQWRDEVSLDEILRSKLRYALERMDVATESKGSLMADVVALVEETLIETALKKVSYVQVAAARFLGINRNTLHKKMKEYDIGTP